MEPLPVETNLDKWLREHGLSVSDFDGLYVKLTPYAIHVPVFSLSGSFIYNITRNLDEFGPKFYYNPSESSPGFYPYGLNLALPSILEKDFVFVVEGFSDVIALRKNGILNVVSTQTSKFSKVSQALVGCFSRRVVLLGDGDDAGEKFINQDVDFDDVSRVMTPPGTDPASFLCRDDESAKRYIVKAGFG